MKRCIPLVALICLAASGNTPITLLGMDGRSVEISRADAEVGVVIHFWATWCPSCITELEELDREVARCGGSGARVVAVNVGEDLDVVRDFWRDQELKLTVLRDPEGNAWRRLGGAGLPINLILTESGRKKEIGPRDAEAWRRLLGELGCIAKD